MSKYFACKINKCNLKHGFTTKFIINHVFLITKKKEGCKILHPSFYHFFM